MKVVLISYQFPEYCVQLANGLAQECDVLLLLPQDTASAYAHALDQRVVFKPFHKPRLRQPVRQLLSITWIVWQIWQFKADSIHIQSGYMWLNFILPLLKLRYPIVMTIHDVQKHPGDKASNTPEWISRLGYNCADQIIVHGKQLQQAAVDRLGFPRERVHTTPQVADIVREKHFPEVAEINNTVLFFGRIWAYKGLEYLIKAEPLITAQLPDARIVIAGRGEDFIHYECMMSNKESFVVYNEFISNQQRDELFQQASIVVLPYIEASISGVIPVAYTFSRPVVATSVGALPELVDDGVTGYLVPPRDVQALADAVVRLLRDPELRWRMGANARHKLNTTFAPELVGRQTKAVYTLTIQSKHFRFNNKSEQPQTKA